MSEAWELAQSNIQTAQGKQKRQHDRGVKNADFQVGDSVFVHMPALKSVPSHKLARPFKGPFQIQKLFPNGARIVPIQSPRSAGLRVALNRLRRCPKELAGSHDNLHGSQQEASENAATIPDCENTLPVSPHTGDKDLTQMLHPSDSDNVGGPAAQLQTDGVWKNRLRQRRSGRGRPELSPGEM